MTPKPVTNTPDPAVAWADRLWDRLHANLFDAQNTIIAIIDAKAWEPLGYESFGKAWIAKMSDVTIAVELRPHIVYEMFSEGLTAEQVSAAVKGVSTETAEELKRQKDNGVPPDQATTIVRRHRRKLPGEWSFLHIKVGRDTLKQWKQLANQHGMTVQGVALPAIVAAFKELAP